jgi:hypothetical protein
MSKSGQRMRRKRKAKRLEETRSRNMKNIENETGNDMIWERRGSKTSRRLKTP